MTTATQTPVLSDRALFFSLMRSPDMRMLRKALEYLSWEAGVDLQDITAMEIRPPLARDDDWELITDQFRVYSYGRPEQEPDFEVEYFHDPQSEHCLCITCEYVRNAYATN